MEGGLRHYVTSFEQYLLEPELRQHVRAPRVRVQDHAWEQMCIGLVDSGIYTVLPESKLCHVQGRPLLNGMFGVTKGESSGGFETHRLIMNLVPLNAICKGIQGDVSTLPSWAGSSPMSLLPEQDMIISSEDVRCFFYIFQVPSTWHKYLAFNRPIPAKLHPGNDEPHYLCSRVLPMGFKNSVSIAQAVHRNIVKRASLRGDAILLREHELRKDKTFPTGDRVHRIYLDNFDILEKRDSKTASIIKGEACDAVLALRAEYEHGGIPNDPKKAVMRASKAEVQGAIIDGKLGCAHPKPEKVIKYTQLALMLLGAKQCSQRQLQVVAGGFVYIATFRRPLMGTLNAVWAFIEEFNKHPPVIRLEIPFMVR